MNFKALESEQKLRGGFYTDPSIAEFLVKWVKKNSPKTLLEPSCGDGAFLQAIEKKRFSGLEKIIGCEIDPDEAAKAQNRTKLPVNVINTDFLSWFLALEHSENLFDAVVGNPPFIRYQYLPNEQQQLAEKIFKQVKLPFTKHTNAWVPFVLASIKLLRPGGRLAMVIPSEIFHIPHAQSLRCYLASQCSKILILDPTEIWFGETLQGTVLLLAEKKENQRAKGLGVGVVSGKDKEILSANPEALFQESSFANGVTIEGKWMPVFLSKNERNLLSQLRSHKEIKQFSEIASVDVGIVTGANKFFLVPDSVVDEFSLHDCAHPMFGRSDHVKGLVYSLNDHNSNKAGGLPANFLWFQDEDQDSLPGNIKKYLEIGLSQSLHTRFKCRTRRCWYKVPSVYSAPVAMLKRAHHYPRLVLNSANAYTTDTAYRIRPINIKPETLVFCFVNSLTCLMAELEGRHYGGGVLELVPSEIERLLIPTVKVKSSELSLADQNFRNIKNDSEFLRQQDLIILGRLGLTSNDQECLYSAWLKLRDRRHRN
jgi:adenine-specific DNA methylase